MVKSWRLASSNSDFLYIVPCDWVVAISTIVIYTVSLRLLLFLLYSEWWSALLGAAAPSKPSSKIPVATRRSRVTRSESRYHSEVRHEAVQHALAQAKAQDRANRAPMPSKRKNSLAAKPGNQHHNNVYRNLQHGKHTTCARINISSLRLNSYVWKLIRHLLFRNI